MADASELSWRETSWAVIGESRIQHRSAYLDRGSNFETSRGTMIIYPISHSPQWLYWVSPGSSALPMGKCYRDVFSMSLAPLGVRKGGTKQCQAATACTCTVEGNQTGYCGAWRREQTAGRWDFIGSDRLGRPLSRFSRRDLLCTPPGRPGIRLAISIARMKPSGDA